METKNLFAEKFEQTLLVSEWNRIVPEETFSALIEKGVLNVVPLEALVGSSRFFQTGDGYLECEIMEQEGHYKLRPLDLMEKPYSVNPKNFVFAKLDWRNFVSRISEANELISVLSPFTIPKEFSYLGYKTVSHDRTIHFLAKPVLNSLDIDRLRSFFVQNAKENVCFVLLTGNPEVVSFAAEGKSFLFVSCGSLPLPTKEFKIDPKLFCKTEFGISLSQAISLAGPNALIVDVKSKSIVYAGKEILSGNNHQVTLMMYLVENPNKDISIEYVAYTLLKKEEWTKPSKPVCDLKNHIIEKVKTTFGQNSEQLKLFKFALPQKSHKERGKISFETNYFWTVILK